MSTILFHLDYIDVKCSPGRRMKLMVLVNTKEEGEEEQAETKLMSTCVDVNWINCA